MFVQTTYHNLHSLQTRAVPRLFSSLKARPSLPVSSHLPHRTISLLSFQHFTSSISLQPLATVSVFATALALLNSNRNHLSCEDVLTPPPSSSQDSVPPESILSIQKLSFGAVSGVCVGIFIRKGLRLIGFLCGASFVFLQYLHSRSLLDVHWSRLSRGYDRFIGSGDRTAAHRFWTFLTADFQARSSFTLGLILGLRIG